MVIAYSSLFKLLHHRAKAAAQRGISWLKVVPQPKTLLPGGSLSGYASWIRGKGSNPEPFMRRHALDYLHELSTVSLVWKVGQHT